MPVDKSATESSFDRVGDVLHYSYVVTNTGNVTLTGVSLVDDQEPVTCTPPVPVVSLAPGASITCTATHTVTQGDLDAGSVVNVATGDSDQTPAETDTVVVPATVAPGLSLVKSITSGDPFDSVGDVISYSYVVTNNGNVRIAPPVRVTDDKATDETCPALGAVGNGDGFLDPGESVTCTATYTVTQADLDAGSVTNLATARAGSTTSDTDSQTATGSQTPSLLVDKSATESSFDAVGDVLHYSYVVTNAGNVTLTGVTLVDDQESVDCAPTVLPATLAPGASITCTATHTVTQGDLDAGSVVNVATGDSEETPAEQDTVTVPGTQTPGLLVEKSATESSFDTVGDVLHYSYVVTNTGNVTLTGVTLVDDQEPVDCAPTVLPATLAPGASFTCTATHTVTQADLDAGSVVNVATADSAETDQVTDTVSVPETQTPALALEKSITGGDPFDAPGDVVTYDLTVTNTGNVRLAGPVTVADDQASDESCPALDTVGNGDGFLDPGESVTCTASYTITQADLDTGSVTNEATATADGTTSNTDTQTATATQTPALAVAKSVDPDSYAAVGEVLTYTYVVTNTGNQTLTGITLADDAETVDCTSTVLPATLAPGASFTCTATHTITQADLDAGSLTNVATADSTQTPPVTDTVTVPREATLTLRKTWVNGAIGDTADLSIDGATTGPGSATATVPADRNGVSPQTATTTVLSGDRVDLAETLGVGNAVPYDSGIACNQPGLSADANGRGGRYQVPAVPVAVTCTITNTRSAAPPEVLGTEATLPPLGAVPPVAVLPAGTPPPGTLPTVGGPSRDLLPTALALLALGALVLGLSRRRNRRGLNVNSDDGSERRR